MRDHVSDVISAQFTVCVCVRPRRHGKFPSVYTHLCLFAHVMLKCALVYRLRLCLYYLFGFAGRQSEAIKRTARDTRVPSVFVVTTATHVRAHTRPAAMELRTRALLIINN